MALDWPQLVKAIRAAPEDPLPRKMAIEWLLDRGDPRGEYLAMHQALVGVPPAGTEAKAIWERIGRFSRKRPWEDAVLALGAIAPEWKRGWLEHARLANEDCANLPRVFELEPLRSVQLENLTTPVARELAELEELASVRRLIVEVARGESAGALLSSPHLRQVEDLVVLPLWKADGEALATSPMRPSSLNLEPVSPFEPATTSTADVLGPSEVISQVTRLRLHGRCAEPALSSFAKGKLGALRLLHSTGPLSASLETLGDRLAPLESLSLFRPDNAVLRSIGGDRVLDHLTEVTLFGASFGREMAIRFGRSLYNLTRFGLTQPNIEQHVFRELAGHFGPRLETLALSTTFQLDLSEAIASPRLAGLKSLLLYDVKFDWPLVQAINTLAARGSLRELTLDDSSPELRQELVIPGVTLTLS